MVVAYAQGPGYHLLVPIQYMRGGPLVKGFRGCGLAVGGKQVYFGVPAEASFREMLCWDGISPKRGKHRLGPLDACHRSRCREPSTLICLGEGGKVEMGGGGEGGNKTMNFVWKWRVV